MKATSYPGIKSIHQWFPANQGFYACYLDWLSEANYSKNAIRLYGFGARIALGLIDKPYFLMDPLADFQRVEDYLILHFPSEGTRSSYHKGVLKLQQYLLQRCHQPAPEKPLHWDYYLGILPVALADGVRSYLGHCRRSWPAELQYRRSIGLLSRLTCSLRWLATNRPFGTAKDLAPALWFDYLDARLAAGITPRTLNSELQSLQSFLRFLSEQEEDICERILKVEPLAEGPHLPRDVPLEQLKMLLATVVVDANSTHAGIRRMGVMDKAWFLLMLHSGFRSGEVRRLRLEDLDLARKRARIVQSKGLKDRIVCLSQTTVDALKAYLDLRGPTPDSHVFIFRHSALSDFYIAQRLETYGWRCGVRITPHQLRHSCATLLLNAGAPILTVQTILGHKHIDTTLGYARLYDGTVAADYYRAMTMVESRMELVQVKPEIPTSSAHLLALVDSLTAGVLSDSQREKIDALRMAVLALVQQQGASTEPVNLPNQAARRSADIACVTP